MIDPKLMVVLLLTIAALAASLRGYRRTGRATASVVLQPVLALLLFALLFPPSWTVPDDRLTVLVAGNTSVPESPWAWMWRWRERVVAMPEAEAPEDVERMPDLASALRRYPQTKAIMVVGNGLDRRDQAAVGARDLQFEAAPERNLVALQTPSQVSQGTQWSLDGHSLPPASHIELRDPAGTIVDMANLAAGDGRFRLSASARSAGSVRYELRVLDARQMLLDTVSIPLVIDGGDALSVILRAGTPDPEFKYWRRWAADAGIAVRAAAGLSEGLSLRDGDVELTPAALAASDLVIVDERAWMTLTATEKTALAMAVENGLGLLLRVTGPLAPEVIPAWAELGFRAGNLENPRSVTLDQRSGLRTREAFTAAPVAVDAADAQTMIAADDGEPLALWRGEGQGRVGIWRLLDSYRLGLIGEPARYASLWQSTLSTLARARPAVSAPQLPQRAWVGERSTLCGLGDAASVRTPDGGRVLLIENTAHCAAYWPAVPGWHRLLTAGAEFPFPVAADDDALGLRAARDRAATLAQVRDTHAQTVGARPARDASLPRVPLFLVWLLLASWLWWRERPG